MNKLVLSLLAGALPLCADFEAALRAFKAGDYGYALTQFAPEAERGSARAQVALGFLYERGLGVSKNAATAAKWYRKSAEQEYGPGEYNFGLFCWHGTGVPQSDAEAVTWLERAAGHGVALAEFDLGNVYYKDGKGDVGKALARWRVAADHNVPAAAYNVAYVYAEGQGFAHDYGQAAKWYRVAAMQNYPLAQYALALLYAAGKGVEADPVESRMWLELAARGGVQQAREEMNSRRVSLSQAQLQEARRRASEWAGSPVAPVGDDAFVTKDDALAKLPNARVRGVPDPGPESYYNKRRRAATGFFVNSEGGVVTSLEIVRSCKELVVLTAQGEKRAEPAGEDVRLGLAVIAIEGGGGSALPIARGNRDEARAVEVGYQPMAHSVTAALGRLRWNGRGMAFQQEKPLDPPLAGGPVLDTEGRVLAVSVAGEGGSTLVAAEELLRFFHANHVPLGGNSMALNDLTEIGAAAKRSLVLVECKANETGNKIAGAP